MIFSRFVEILDRATCVPAIATWVADVSPIETALLHRTGYRGRYIILTRLSDLRSEHTSSEWGDRTMMAAHGYIEEWGSDAPEFQLNFPDGKVIDVEFILGEKPTARKSDCHGYEVVKDCQE